MVFVPLRIGLKLRLSCFQPCETTRCYHLFNLWLLVLVGVVLLKLVNYIRIHIIGVRWLNKLILLLTDIKGGRPRIQFYASLAITYLHVPIVLIIILFALLQ